MIDFLNCLKIRVWGGSFVSGGSLGGKGRLDSLNHQKDCVLSTEGTQVDRQVVGFPRLGWRGSAEISSSTLSPSIPNCPALGWVVLVLCWR